MGLTCNDGEPFEDLSEPERYPYISGQAVYLDPNPDGSCPEMCPAEADPLFWQAFLDDVAEDGLDESTDPNCLEEGYLVEKACRFVGNNFPDKCVYHALVATACKLGPSITP